MLELLPKQSEGLIFGNRKGTCSGEKQFVNDGAWVDENKDVQDYNDATHIFTVIKTCDKDIVELYKYEKEGTITDIKTKFSSK